MDPQRSPSEQADFDQARPREVWRLLRSSVGTQRGWSRRGGELAEDGADGLLADVSVSPREPSRKEFGRVFVEGARLGGQGLGRMGTVGIDSILSEDGRRLESRQVAQGDDRQQAVVEDEPAVPARLESPCRQR